MKVYRIERKKYLDTTLEGIGASLSDGFRWNSKNTRIVYTSGTRSLALLEIAVHLDLSEDLPDDRYFVEINIPDDIEISVMNIKDLDTDWDDIPPNTKTQYIGDEFVRNNISAVLKVPSCVIHQEFNYLINPYHPDFKRITVVRCKDKVVFDERLKKNKTTSNKKNKT